MSAKKLILFLVLFVLAAALGALLVSLWGGGLAPGAEEPYYAVQMENGDIYFGKLTRFPRFALRDVYIPQSFSDPTNPLGTSLRVISLSQASIWKAGSIELNRDKMLSISKVADDSEVMRSIKGR